MDRLISEKDVLDILRDYYRAWFLNDKKFMDAVNAIKAIPSAEPKTGHWILTSDYFTGAYENIDYVECSCCHEYSLEEGDFCPNCGTRMFEP